MGKRKYLFLIILIFLSQLIFSNEKEIVNFRFEKYNLLESRIHLVDENGNENNGYFSNVKKPVFFGTIPLFSTNSIQDKTTEFYQSKVDSNDILNMIILRNKSRFWGTSGIINSSIGLAAFIPGIIMLSAFNYYNPNYNFSAIHDKSVHLNSYLHAGLVFISIGTVFGLFGFVSTIIAIVNCTKYKKAKEANLKLLNDGIIISNRKNKPLMKLGFDLQIN